MGDKKFKNPDDFDYPFETKEEIECCLNCKREDCTGNCIDVKRARKKALLAHKNKPTE